MEKKDDLLPIGVVAKSFGVNESSIRRMEDAGLLKPAYVARESKYRYYDSENISRIATILSLRSYGFIYEDMRGYFVNPGDYSPLISRLAEKQAEIAFQIDKLRRRLKADDPYRCEMLDYPETYCVTKTVTVRPGLSEITGIAKQFYFDAVREKLPINYNRAVLILTDCTDYRSFQRSREQELTFCVPLRKKAEGPNVLFLPSETMVAVTWSLPVQEYSSFLPTLDELFGSLGIRQKGALRATLDVGTHMGQDIPPEHSVVHLLIPFEADPAADGDLPRDGQA